MRQIIMSAVRLAVDHDVMRSSLGPLRRALPFSMCRVLCTLRIHFTDAPASCTQLLTISLVSWAQSRKLSDSLDWLSKCLCRPTSSALEPRIVRVTAEGDLAALFGVGCGPPNQVTLILTKRWEIEFLLFVTLDELVSYSSALAALRMGFSR